MEREAIIVVDREAGKGGKVRLNYLVGAVAWHPEYKLRAAKEKEPVEIDYLANVMQHSGEDWNHVKMTLSTAQPMLNASPPELCMLEPILARRANVPAQAGEPKGISPFANSFSYGDIQKKANMSRQQAAQLNSRQAPMAGMGGMPGMPAPNGVSPPPNFQMPVFDTGKANKEADKALNDASALEQNIELMKSRDELLSEKKKSNSILADSDPSRSDGPSVTYHLPAKLTVPSRRDEQVIEVVKLNMTPKYYYKAVPVLNRHVYRLADLVNNSSHVLLPGEATMYQGTDFVGRMPMPLVAIGEEFTAGFGVDTQLQIQRQMVDQARNNNGGNQVLKYEYRILVSSFKSEPVKLQLWDRLPKGENENIVVVLGKSVPELSKDGIYLRESRPNNLLRWDLEVAPNCNGEKAFHVTYEFRMELDRQLAITGFQSR
jgi:hypothetical protein